MNNAPETLELLQEIESFLQAGRVAESRLGREALRDPNFVSELRGGRVVRASTRQRVRAYIQSKQGEH